MPCLAVIPTKLRKFGQHSCWILLIAWQHLTPKLIFPWNMNVVTSFTHAWSLNKCNEQKNFSSSNFDRLALFTFTCKGCFDSSTKEKAIDRNEKRITNFRRGAMIGGSFVYEGCERKKKFMCVLLRSGVMWSLYRGIENKGFQGMLVKN